MKMCEIEKLVSSYNDRVIDGMKSSLAFLEAVDESLVDAEPVVHAHWANERCNNNMWIANCTACGSESTDERYRGVSEFHKYCHWCGAKMDEEVR